MVSSDGCCTETKRDGFDSVIQLCKYDQITLSRKRLKVSELVHCDLSSHICEEPSHDGAASSMELSHTCLGSIHNSSSCCNCDDDVGLNSGVEMSCQSNGGDENISHQSNTGGSSYPIKTYTGYASPAFVSAWMYVNEQGQMCGPYIQEQLYEGLSTGFLPDELPVYPIMNGSLINPVPLKYFKQFPDHVTTGFVYLHASVSGVKSPTISHSNMASSRPEFARTSVSYNSQAAFHSYFNNNNINSNQQSPIPGAACLNMPYMPVVIELYLAHNFANTLKK